MKYRIRDDMKYRIRDDREISVSFFSYLILKTCDAMDDYVFSGLLRKYRSPEGFLMENWFAGHWLRHSEGDKYQQVLDKLDRGDQ